MYDTIVLKSPEIDLETKDKILNFCNKYEGIDFSTGEIIYSFTRGNLDGSYDYRIAISVDNTDWIKENSMSPVKVQTYWHVKVECSLHKILLNHNVYGGSCNVKNSIKYLIKFLNNTLMVELPNYKVWEVEKIDVSKIFKFNEKSICKRIISNLVKMYYTRRKPQVYDTSVMFAGSTTTNKIYWKGAEFKKHDYKRMMKYIAREVDLSYSEDNGDLKRSKLALLKMKYDKLLELSYRIIRFECSIKFRKLKELFGSEKVYVKMLDDNILHEFMNFELKKLIKEDEEMDIVRRSDLVLERLLKEFGTAKGNSLYSTWTKLVQFGEVETKETLSKTTFYRHKTILIQSGISWQCSVVNLKPFSIVPDDFSFTNNNYVYDVVDNEVLEKLKEVS